MCGFLYPLAKVSTLEEPKVFTRVRDSRVLETQECDMHSSFFADIRRVTLSFINKNVTQTSEDQSTPYVSNYMSI
jgi:hypothetical protein